MPDVEAGGHDCARQLRDHDQVVNSGIAWFSVALGMPQLLAPHALTRLIGVRPTTNRRPTMRAFGAGARLEADSFTSPAETVSGPLTYGNGATGAAGIEATSVSEQFGVVTAAAIDATIAGLRTVRHAVSISRSAQELYAFWRNFENLPIFRRHLQEVTTHEGGRSRWVTRGPGGVKVEWDAEIVADVPGLLIAWQSLPPADVRNAGTVRFVPVPAGRGTAIHVELDYRPLAGTLGTMVAKLFRAAPGQQLRDDLQAFKSLMETGEVLYANSTATQPVVLTVA